MEARCTYLYRARGVRASFILAPNLTIYASWFRTSHQACGSTFEGIAHSVQQPPLIETGETYQERGGLFNDDGVETTSSTAPRSARMALQERCRSGFRRMNDYFGQPSHDYLK